MTDDILFERRGAAGIVTLNRPQALNAVTHGMVRALARATRCMGRRRGGDAGGRSRPRASGRFRAGGDIRELYDLGQAGRHDEALQFWRDEYRLNTAIKNYPQALCRADRRHRHGRRRRRIGARLAPRGRRPLPVRHAGGRHRLFPGCRRHLVPAAHAGRARHLLRAHRRALRHCRRRGGGLATHRIAVGALCRAARRAVPAPCRSTPCWRPLRSRRARGRSWRGAPPSTGCLPAIRSRASSRRSSAKRPGGADAAWAGKTAATIRTKSPLSLKLALAQVRRGKTWDFETCMRAEFRIVSRVIQDHDFYEGVRAVIVDKDNTAALAAGNARRGERGGGRAPFRAARKRRSGAAMTEPAYHDDLHTLEPVHEPSGRAGRSAAGRAGWCCSCA